MRNAFILFACLLCAGVCVDLVATDSPSSGVPESRENAAPQPTPGVRHIAYPDRPWHQLSRQEREHWRRMRFWDYYEPTHTIHFELPEIYVERFAARNIIDTKSTVYDVSAVPIGRKGVRLEGKVLWKEYANGLEQTFKTLGFDPVESEIVVLPADSLGKDRFGFVTTHTLDIRRYPQARAEQLDQAALGDGVRLLDQSPDGHWLRVIASDGYIGWAADKYIHRVDETAWNQYFQSPRWARVLHPIKLTRENKLVAEIPATSGLPLVEGQGAKSVEVKTRGEVEEIRGKVPGPWLSEAVPDDKGGADSDAAKSGDNLGQVAVVRLPLPPPNDVAALPADAVKVYSPLGADMTADIHRIADPLLGVPYVWGGISERGVDCSGFTQYVYRVLGMALARDADEQSISGHLVFRRGESFNSLRPGDLLFFIDRTGRISHVALSLGGTEYIHASKGKVFRASLDPESPIFIRGNLEKLAFARRLIFGNYQK